MAIARVEPDDVARPDLLHRVALALRESEPGGDDRGLAERVSVSSGACAGFESDVRRGGAAGIVRRE